MIANINQIVSSVAGATTNVWDKAIWLLPNLIFAFIIVLVGWMVSVILGKVAEKILKKIGINKLVDKIGLDKALADIHLGGDVAGFVGALIKWFFAIAFFLAAANIFQLTQVADFLNMVLLYIPNIIAVVIILAIGIFVANILDKIIHKSATISGFMSPDILGSLTKWIILIIAILASLEQLGIAPNLIDRLVTGIVLMVALAGGLAFGLGGKEKAKEVLDRIGRK